MNTEKVRWSPDEVQTLAKELVKLRCQYPFPTLISLSEQAQEKCFTPDRRRHFTSMDNVPALVNQFQTLWQNTISAEPPPPQIIQVPVEKEPDYIDILNRLPDGTLASLLVERLLQRFGNNSHKPESNGTATARSNGTGPTLAQIMSKPALEKKREVPRVAICSPDSRMFSELQDEVKKFNIPVELRFVDLDCRKPAIPESANFVIFPYFSHASSAWKAARDGWPSKNIIEIGAHSGTLTACVAQKLRDIASMKPAAPVK